MAVSGSGPGKRAQPLEDKNAAKRPDANKGGREEEENRLGIASGPQGPGSLRNKKLVCQCRAPQSGTGESLSPGMACSSLAAEHAR